MKWQYVGKFGYAIGQGRYEVRLREAEAGSLLPDTRLELEIYVDEDWPVAEAQTDVCRKRAHAKKTRALPVGQAGEWGAVASGLISQNVRPHVWYFAVADCGGALSNGTYPFDLEIEWLQAGGSHFSVERKWAPTANLLALCGCGIFIYSFWRRSRDFLDRNGSLHPVIWTLACVVCSQCLARCLHAGHLALYTADGQGSLLLEGASQILAVVVEVVQASLLVLIALGYTLLRADLGSLDAVLPVCGLVALVHVVLLVLDKAQSEASHRFADHDGAAGWAFVGLRLALYAWFVFAVRNTASCGGLKLKAFLGQFSVAASLYFLAYPVMFLAMQLFAPYLREPVMDVGMTVTQVASNLWLASLFLDRGAYFQASSLSASPLPGAGSPVFFKTD